jgi:hypothetical protein
MSTKHHKEREEPMYKRILKSATVGLALLVLAPVGNALATRLNDSGGYVAHSKPIVSEKIAGLSTQVGPTKAEYRALMLRSEALNRKYGLGDFQVGPTKAEYRALMLRSEALNKKYGLGEFRTTSPVVSEKVAGLQLPTKPETTVSVSTSSDFDWGDAGIGAGVISVAILAAMGGALTLRRHGTLAH